MSTENEALIIDLPVTDITVDHDPDGLPKTVPVEPREKKPAPAPKDDDAIRQVKRERDEALAARARERDDAEARIAAAENARAKAEGEAGQNKDIASRAYWDKLHGEYAQIESSIQTYKTLAETAKSHLRQVELARAKGEGDPEKLADAAVDAQERLAEAKAALLTLEQGKMGAADEIKRTRAALEAEAQGKKDAKPEVKEPKKDDAPKRQETPDEWIARWPKRTTGNWLKDNRQFVEDKDKHAELLDFINKEFIPEWGANNLHTQNFIDALNEKFGPAEAETEEPEMAEEEEAPAPVAQPVKKKVVAAAPVGRNGGYYSSKSPNNSKVWMRPQLVQAAKDIGEDPKTYVESVKELIKRGKFPKDYLDPDFDYESWNNRRS